MHISGTQRNWVTYSSYTLPSGETLPLAELNPEFVDQIQRQALERLHKPSARAELSTDQLRDLKSKYDSNDMTYDEYQAFLDDLVNMGLLTENDKYKVGGTKEIGGCHLSPVDLLSKVSIREGRVSASSTFSLFPSYPSSDYSEKTDITEWVRYRSSYDTFYFDQAGGLHKGREDELFQTVSDILSKMHSL